MFRYLILSGVCLGFLTVGILLGWVVGVAYTLPDTPLQVKTVVSPKVPVVKIEGIRDGQLVGKVSGEVRLFLAGDQVLPSKEGDFVHPPQALLTNIRSVFIPEGMNFVASKKGTKYYSVESSAGKNIAVKNRMYFATEEEAKDSGYHF